MIHLSMIKKIHYLKCKKCTENKNATVSHTSNGRMLSDHEVVRPSKKIKVINKKLKGC